MIARCWSLRCWSTLDRVQATPPVLKAAGLDFVGDAVGAAPDGLGDGVELAETAGAGLPVWAGPGAGCGIRLPPTTTAATTAAAARTVAAAVRARLRRAGVCPARLTTFGSVEETIERAGWFPGAAPGAPTRGLASLMSCSMRSMTSPSVRS